MKSLNLDRLLDTAVQAALLGSRVLLENFGKLKPSEVQAKAVNDFVTRVDRESEEQIRAFLRSRYPEISFLGEEEGGQQAEVFWLVDPLDGTTNYIHGFPFFSVSIALMQEGVPVLGVVYDPVRQDLFAGRRGGGAWRNHRRIRVSARRHLPGTLIATGFPFRAKHMLDAYLLAFRQVFQAASGVRRAGSAALDLAMTAAGVVDGFFEFGLSGWDIAAGALLVQEAGGIVTDFQGGPRFLETGNVLAGPEPVVQELLPIIREAFGGIP